jgi:hypothetical protein
VHAYIYTVLFRHTSTDHPLVHIVVETRCLSEPVVTTFLFLPPPLRHPLPPPPPPPSVWWCQFAMALSRSMRVVKTLVHNLQAVMELGHSHLQAVMEWGQTIYKGSWRMRKPPAGCHRVRVKLPTVCHGV